MLPLYLVGTLAGNDITRTSVAANVRVRHFVQRKLKPVSSEPFTHVSDVVRPRRHDGKLWFALCFLARADVRA